MKNQFLFSAAILTAVFLLRWQFLQLIAWASMFARYSWSHGMLDGWRMTFDGNHPCAICHAVAAGGGAQAAALNALASHPSLLVLPVALLLAAPTVSRAIRSARP